MNINDIRKVLDGAKLCAENRKKAEKVFERMKSEGVTDLLRGQLVQIINDELEMNKTEAAYFRDLRTTIDNILDDAEKRLRMADEEIEEGEK